LNKKSKKKRVDAKRGVRARNPGLKGEITKPPHPPAGRRLKLNSKKPAPPADHSRPPPRLEQIVARAAVKLADDTVRTRTGNIRTGNKNVVAGPAIEIVGATGAVEIIVAVAAKKHVAGLAADDKIVAAAPIHCEVIARAIEP